MQVNCELDGYNNTIKKSLCECEVKIKLPFFSEIIINKDALFKKFTNIKNILNLNIMKCYKELFSKEGLINNIGSYFLLLIITANIVNIFIFIFNIKGFKLLIQEINKIISINLQINNNNNHKKKNKEKSRNLRNSKSSKNTNSKLSLMHNGIINERIINNNISINVNLKKVKHKHNHGKRNKNIKIKSKNISVDKTKESHNFKNSYSISKIQKNNNHFLKSFHKPKNTIGNFFDYELNILPYNEALKIDKRTYFEYYFSLLRSNQLLVFTFYAKNDYNSGIIKISLFLFSLSLYYAINALFFDDSTMHIIYEEKGNYNFIYQIPKIIYSSFITFIVHAIVRFFSLSQRDILSIKREKYNIKVKSEKLKICLKIKFILFFILEFLLLFLFWYYISCFCAIYKNTQLHLLEDSVISFGLSLLYPIGFCLIPGMFRIPALRSSNKNRECMYKFSNFLQII